MVNITMKMLAMIALIIVLDVKIIMDARNALLDIIYILMDIAMIVQIIATNVKIIMDALSVLLDTI